jgi:hypothetical protein
MKSFTELAQDNEKRLCQVSEVKNSEKRMPKADKKRAIGRTFHPGDREVDYGSSWLK